MNKAIIGPIMHVRRLVESFKKNCQKKNKSKHERGILSSLSLTFFLFQIATPSFSFTLCARWAISSRMALCKAGSIGLGGTMG